MTVFYQDKNGLEPGYHVMWTWECKKWVTKYNIFFEWLFLVHLMNHWYKNLNLQLFYAKEIQISLYA